MILTPRVRRTAGPVFVVLLAACLLPNRRALAQGEGDTLRVPVNVSLVPGFSTGWGAGRNGRQVVNHLSLNLPAGRSQSLRGVELGIAWNGVTQNVRGTQLVGGVNSVGGNVAGVQLAGGGNYVGGDLRGAQAAGLLNVVRGTASGTQVAVANVAGRSEGLQLGVVNYARSSTGTPLGLFSFVRDFGLRSDTWGDETGGITTAIRSGNRRFANYIGVTVHPGAENGRWGLMAGLGREFRVGRRGYVGLEAVSETLEGSTDVGSISRLRAAGGVELGRGVSLIAGPSLALFVSAENDGREFAPMTLGEGRWRGMNYRTWPGAHVGVRFGASPSAR